MKFLHDSMAVKSIYVRDMVARLSNSPIGHRSIPKIATCISFPKSGRTWLRVILDDLDVPLAYTHHGSGNHSKSFGRDLRQLILDPLRVTEGEIVFMYRNPIDVSVSYFHECHKRTKIKVLRKMFYARQGRLPPVSLSDFVLSSRFGVPKIAHFNLQLAKETCKCQRVLFVSYEVMRQDAVNQIKQIISFLGQDRSDIEIKRAVQDADFDVMKSRERQGNYESKYGRALLPRDIKDDNTYKVRRGKVGGYVDELDLNTLNNIHEFLSNNYYFEKMAEFERINRAIVFC